MHPVPVLGFGSVRPCRAFTRRFDHAQTASSQPSRMHFGTDSKCICCRHSCLGVWGHVGPLHGDLGTHKPLRHNPHECISARILNASGPHARVWGVGPCWAFTWRFGHAQTASSQPSRMHFGTDSKCICCRHSCLGVWGHVGPLHGDLGTHKPLRHQPDECVRH